VCCNCVKFVTELKTKLFTVAGSKEGFEVNQLFPEKGNMGLVLPEYLTKWTTEKVRKEGVNVLPESLVQNVGMEGDRVKLTLSNGHEVSWKLSLLTCFLSAETFWSFVP